MQLMLTLLNFNVVNFNVVKGEMKSHQYFIFQLVLNAGHFFLQLSEVILFK